MKFTYKATNEEGEEYKGEVEVNDRFEVYAHVRKEGGVVVSIEEKRGGLGNINMDRINALISRVKQAEKIIFARNLSAMLSAGLSVSRALDVMERQTKNPKLNEIIHHVKEDISKGDELHAAMERHPKAFPKIMVAMVRAGEESGKLAESLKLVGEQMERVYILQKKIKGAMIYPAIIIVALFGVGMLMMIYIVPTLTQTFEELQVELPTSTKIIIGISDFLANHTFMAFGLIIASVVGFIYALRTDRGRRVFNTVILYIPMIKGIVKEANAARMGRTLSSLLSSGVQVVSAFEITEDVIQNHHFKNVIGEARERIQKGAQISVVFSEHENLYPPLVGELIAVGEETGKLPDMLTEVAQFYEGEVEQKTKNMSTFIEPFLMLIVGGAVGFFAVSMITPIYSVTSGL